MKLVCSLESPVCNADSYQMRPQSYVVWKGSTCNLVRKKKVSWSLAFDIANSSIFIDRLLQEEFFEGIIRVSKEAQSTQSSGLVEFYSKMQPLRNYQRKRAFTATMFRETLVPFKSIKSGRLSKLYAFGAVVWS